MRDNDAVYEFKLRRIKVRELKDGDRRSSPEMVHKFLEAIGLPEEENERVVVLSLDNRNNIRGYHTAAIGSGNCCSVKPVDVFRTAFMEGAKSVIIAHNHPSGCPVPSPEDITFSKRMADAGKIMNMPVIDSLIVAENGFTSLMSEGKLD